MAGTTLILVHHVGANSGIERVTPVAASLREDGRCVIVASNGGSLTHPAWCHNLRANPRIEVELGTETFTVLAEELEGPARAEVWPEAGRRGSSGRRVSGQGRATDSGVQADPHAGGRAQTQVGPLDVVPGGLWTPELDRRSVV